MGHDEDKGGVLRAIEFPRIKGGKPFNVELPWFGTLLGEIGQAKLLVRVEQAACIEITAERGGRAVEIGTGQQGDAIGENDAGNIVGTRQGMRTVHSSPPSATGR